MSSQVQGTFLAANRASVRLVWISTVAIAFSFPAEWEDWKACSWGGTEVCGTGQIASFKARLPPGESPGSNCGWETWPPCFGSLSRSPHE